MNKSIFITGTSTDIGKTLISAMLLSAGITHGLKPAYFKPIQTGSDSDCATVQRLTGCEDHHILQPVFSFAMPVTPHLAARAENKTVDHQQIKQHFEKNAQHPCIVEGAGGLLSPICEKTLGRDLIKTLDLPTLVVASTVLGTMNHTLLTIEAAQKIGLTVKGIILSGNTSPDLVEVLTHFSAIPVLAEVPMLDTHNRENFMHQSAAIFHPALLSEIFS